MHYTPLKTPRSIELPHREWQPTDFSGGQIAVLATVLLLLITVPVWTHPVPPLSDYINHLARMHVIARAEHDVDLARFYQIDWQIIPNLRSEIGDDLLVVDHIR